MNLYKNIKRILKKYRGKDEYSIDFENAKNLLKNDKKALLIDVRSKQEYREGHLEGSINISLYDIERGNFIKVEKNTTIILYCEQGKRSKKAMKFLRENGYENVYHIEGGLNNI